MKYSILFNGVVLVTGIDTFVSAVAGSVKIMNLIDSNADYDCTLQMAIDAEPSAIPTDPKRWLRIARSSHGASIHVQPYIE